MQPKQHLKKIYRTSFDMEKRQDFLRLDMNENPDGLPIEFIDEVLNYITPDFLASYPYSKKLINKIASINNISQKNICLSNGSDAGIKYLFDAYIEKGDKVLLTDPTFAMYDIYCKIFDAKSINVTYNNGASFPLNDFLSAMDDIPKFAVIVNPNNPIGSHLEKKNILKILDKAKKLGILIIVDEAYYYYFNETMTNEIKQYDNLIVLRSFSKLCSLATIRLGYLFANENIINNLKKVTSGFDINGFAIIFALKLLEKKGLIEKLIKNAKEGKKKLIKNLNKHKIPFIDTKANFILIKCNKFTKDIKNDLFAKKILVKGDFLKNYIRVTIGGVQTMDVFFNVFYKIWRKLN